MTITRRLAALGIVLLPVIGLIVCMAAIVGIWVGKTRFDLVVAALSGTTVKVLCDVEVQLDRARQALKESQQRVSDLSSIAERLKTAESFSSEECEPIIQSVDDLLDDLRLAGSRLESRSRPIQRVRSLKSCGLLGRSSFRLAIATIPLPATLSLDSSPALRGSKDD